MEPYNPFNVSSFELYSYVPPTKCESDDDSLQYNLTDRIYMDITLLVTRTSICQQGFMGCLVVKPTSVKPTSAYTILKPDTDADTDTTTTSSTTTPSTTTPSLTALKENILITQVNVPFYSNFDSDVHAEIHAIATAAGAGVSLKDTTVYISMPPCKNCFQALVKAGVRRIVSRKRVCDAVRTWLDGPKNESGVSYTEVPDTDASKARLLELVKNSGCMDVEKIQAEVSEEE
jgi:deoxycytidylate deaminase